MSVVMGQRIHDKRRECGYTLRDLADKLKVSPQTVSKWELGKVKNIDRDYITRMAAMFHVTPEWLMHLEDSPKVTATYNAPGKEPITVTVNKEPIMGVASLRGQLYQAALDVKPENLKVAIEILKSLSDDPDPDDDEKLA